MPRVVHFEINADDPRRAAEFYQKVFGWQINKWEGPQEYWLVTTGEDKEPGINGGITARMGGWATVNTVGVESLDDAVQKVVEAGGKVVMPKTEIPEVGYLAYCTDTEGNPFGMMQPTGMAQ